MFGLTNYKRLLKDSISAMDDNDDETVKTLVEFRYVVCFLWRKPFTSFEASMRLIASTFVVGIKTTLFKYYHKTSSRVVLMQLYSKKLLNRIVKMSRILPSSFAIYSAATCPRYTSSSSLDHSLSVESWRPIASLPPFYPIFCLAD